MDLNIIATNLFSPPILFFMLGLLAALVKSDLQIPQPIAKFLSMYLLMAIGFRGGVELAHSGINQEVFVSIAAAVLLALIVPIYVFFIARIKMDVFNAGAIAATYGSVSAVNFIAACAFLEQMNVSYGGYMVANLALMESPAIIIGVLLVRMANTSTDTEKIDWKELLRDAFLNGSVFLIIGSLVIGILSGENGAKMLKPFTGDIFQGMQAFFLLDMGLVAAKRIGDLKKNKFFLIAFTIFVPLINAALGMLVAYVLHLPKGDAFLLTLLAASASYIAVPAAMRLSVPEANPSIYVPMSLAFTFPFNIAVGMPLYFGIISKLWPY